MQASYITLPPDSSLTIVMYHYVRDVAATPFPQIKAISTRQFREQIKKLKKNYELISPSALLNFISGQGNLPKSACLLSFDDGLSDHYSQVFPILREQNLSALFFPITISLEGKVADVHKIHFLLAKCGVTRLANLFHVFLENYDEETKTKYWISDKEKIDSRYRFDDVLTANLKVRLNTLPDGLKSAFLSKTFESEIGNEKKFSEDLYLSKANIAEMHSAGMVFGSHTHTHQRLDKLSAEGQENELSISKNILEKLTGGSIHFTSYPYGNYHQTMLEILLEKGYSVGLGTEVGINSGIIDRFALKRLNANEI